MVQGGNSFKNTPPSISDWMMLRFTSSARFGCGLNIGSVTARVPGFIDGDKSPLGLGPTIPKYRRGKAGLGCKRSGMTAPAQVQARPMRWRRLEPSALRFSAAARVCWRWFQDARNTQLARDWLRSRLPCLLRCAPVPAAQILLEWAHQS